MLLSVQSQGAHLLLVFLALGHSTVLIASSETTKDCAACHEDLDHFGLNLVQHVIDRCHSVCETHAGGLLY